jgi:hypothetical protein
MVGDVLWEDCCSVAMDVSNVRIDGHLLQAKRIAMERAYRSGQSQVIDCNACL